MVESMLDPYAVLGVPLNATPQQVARAHRRLAKRFHPDLHAGPGAAERMQRINRAWQILSSPTRRARYDAGRRSPATATYGHWTPAGEAAYAAWRPSAARPRRRRPPRPEPLEPSFGDNPWATALVSAVLALMLFIGTYLGSMSR